jgi:uncharacterized protein (DUF433 family)
MATTTPVATHIYLDERGRPWIEGTNTKVIEVAMDKVAWGWEPEHIQRQYPHLPLSKIYAAFSYYYDHKDEIDAEIERQDKEVEALRAAAIAAGTQPTRAEMERRFAERQKASGTT